MGFTEKKFAHLPARESQLKEPPLPKSKRMKERNKDKDEVYIEIEDKDPVWLKDKGDHFFKRHDYHAAINAYSRALKEDPEFMSGRLNRAACYIMVRAYDLCIEDCNDLETQIKAIKKEEYESD